MNPHSDVNIENDEELKYIKTYIQGPRLKFYNG